MAINFPNSPIAGDTYSFNGKFFTYDGVKWRTSSAAGTGISQQIFTANGTYTPSAGLLQAVVECRGGGGGGGAAIGKVSETHVGGGGGQGSYSRSVLSAEDIGASQTVTIGLGGAGGVVGSVYGANGTGTSFGSLVTTNGGLGGQHGDAGHAFDVGGGGAVGTGDFSTPGACGEAALNNPAGSAHTWMYMGAGGGEGGGPAAGYWADGNPGVFGGGGSGGHGAFSANNFSGGAGGDGYCIVTEYLRTDYATDLVEVNWDSTPVLGGNLDLNGKTMFSNTVINELGGWDVTARINLGGGGAPVHYPTLQLVANGASNYGPCIQSVHNAPSANGDYIYTHEVIGKSSTGANTYYGAVYNILEDNVGGKSYFTINGSGDNGWISVGNGVTSAVSGQPNQRLGPGTLNAANGVYDSGRRVSPVLFAEGTVSNSSSLLIDLSNGPAFDRVTLDLVSLGAAANNTGIGWSVRFRRSGQGSITTSNSYQYAVTYNYQSGTTGDTIYGSEHGGVQAIYTDVTFNNDTLDKAYIEYTFVNLQDTDSYPAVHVRGYGKHDLSDANTSWDAYWGEGYGYLEYTDAVDQIQIFDFQGDNWNGKYKVWGWYG